MNCGEQVLDKLREFFYSRDIFDKDWEKSTDTNISILIKMNYIRDQINIINNKDKKE